MIRLSDLVSYCSQYKGYQSTSEDDKADGNCIHLILIFMEFSQFFFSISVCNCAVHKKCHEKILGNCPGSAKDSRETKVNTPNIFNSSSYEPPRNKTGPEVIKLFSCSTQLSKKFQLLIKN